MYAIVWQVSLCKSHAYFGDKETTNKVWEATAVEICRNSGKISSLETPLELCIPLGIRTLCSVYSTQLNTFSTENWLIFGLLWHCFWCEQALNANHLQFSADFAVDSAAAHEFDMV